MRKVAMLGGAALIVGAFAPISHANLLQDPGFETPVGAGNIDVQVTSTTPTGTGATNVPWYDLINYTAAGKTGDTAFVSSDIAPPTNTPPTDRVNSGKAAGSNTASTGGNTAHTGDQFVYAFTIGQASGTQGGVGQLVTGINAGDSYVGSAYFFDKDNGGTGADGDNLHSSATNGGPSSADSVQLIWQDATGTQIGSAVTSLTTLAGGPNGTPGPLENQWVQLTTGPVTAPPNATQVLFQLVDTRGTSGGVLFADDADLEDLSAVPEPASLGVLSAGALLLSFRRRKC